MTATRTRSVRGALAIKAVTHARLHRLHGDLGTRGLAAHRLHIAARYRASIMGGGTWKVCGRNAFSVLAEYESLDRAEAMASDLRTRGVRVSVRWVRGVK